MFNTILMKVKFLMKEKKNNNKIWTGYYARHAWRWRTGNYYEFW